MTYLDIVLITVIQGLGGVLPLSASGHFALFSGLSTDAHAFAAVSIAAHLGAAFGIMVWLWRDFAAMAIGPVRLIKGKSDPGARLFLIMLTASLPLGLLSLWLLTVVVPPHGQLLAAGCLLGFGVLLALADRLGVTVSRIEHLGFAAAAVVGLLQVLALVPGVSRTGVVVTAARLMGFERRDAARLSLLLGVPVLIGFAALRLWQLAGTVPFVLSADLLLAAGLAAVVAWGASAALLRWLGRHTFLPFYLWRIMLGAGVIGLYFLAT